MQRTEVVLRHSGSSGVGHTLTEVQDVAELERLLDHLRQIGIYAEESGDIYHGFKTQYVLSDDGAYFEVIIGDD